MMNRRRLSMSWENGLGFSRYDVPYERRDLTARTMLWMLDENQRMRHVILLQEMRISGLEITNEQQLKRRNYLNEKIRNLQNDLNDHRDELNHVKDELERKEKECRRVQQDLESQHEDADFQTRITNEKNVQLQRTVEKLQQDIEKFTKDRSTTESTYRPEIAVLKDELRQERINANVRKPLYKCMNCINADEINNQLCGANADLRNKLEKLHQEKKWNETLRDTIQNAENSKLQNEVDQLHNKVESLSKQLVKIRGDAEFKEKEYARMEKTLTDNNEENARLKNSFQMLKEKNLELQNKVEQLLYDKTQLADHLKHEKDSRKKKESCENSSLQEENRKLQKEVEHLHRKTEILNDKLTHALESASAMKKENECVQLQKTSTENNIKQANINAADEIQTKLREKISELEYKVDQLLDDKNMLAEELRHEKDTVTNKDSHKNSKLKEKNQKLQNEFDELFHKYQSLKTQLMREKENFKLKEKECIDMHQMMKSQKEHDLNLKATNVRSKQLDERNAELNNEIQRLRQERSNMTDELKHEREVRKKLEQYGNKTLQETNQTLRNDVTQLRFQNERLREDLTGEKDNFKKMEKEFFKRSSDMKEKLEKQEQELERQTKKLSEQSVLNRNVDPGAKKTQADLQQQLDETRARLKNVQKELDDAKSRLSRAMGDKLTDNNPNIADLSDKNRPTKISERYQELYDNQWTDAFEIVNGKYVNEENTINVLRDILMDTLEFCKTQAANQMIQIRASFLKGEDLPANMNKQVKECRKAMAELYGKGLYREYCDQLRTSKPESMSTPSYVKECFEICWLMAVQDPPVEFGPDLHRGDTFNKEHYRAYTRSGERVDFVVWPVLLLHQNGPVLCKGVAQGK